MYEKLENCPGCKHTQFTNHLICTDHTVSGESFALVKCSKCQLIFTNPRPDSSYLSKYYESDEYISHTSKGNSPINIIYKLVRNYTLKNKVKLLNQLSQKGKVLDYGCGTGDFLEKAQKNGWVSYGYEPEKKAREKAEKKQLTLVKNIRLIETKFDIITAWHVIEHVSDLRKTIKSLKKILTDDGYMIIALPNLNSYDASHYKEYWAAYDVPRHLYHFSQNSFARLVRSLKLQIVDTLPMIFDSYYVSMLSEKYKTGKVNLLNAIQIGYKSNSLAKSSGEYSSLIYILKK